MENDQNWPRYDDLWLKKKCVFFDFFENRRWVGGKKIFSPIRPILYINIPFFMCFLGKM
jgi:hypothetical protein